MFSANINNEKLRNYIVFKEIIYFMLELFKHL